MTDERRPRPFAPPGDATAGHRRVVVAAALGAAAVLAVLAVVASLGWLPVGGSSDSADTSMTAADSTVGASAFLENWVDPDGRVVRRDQGGDTVSEGQAYGMLLAVAVDDRAAFDRIWTWTQQHLQQQAGALAWRWQDGHVLDANPATDADLDAVRALQLAARTWNAPGLADQADRIATATLQESTVPVAEGRLLVAGPWATGAGSTPAMINPSYLVAGQAAELASSTGQPEWRQVARATAVMDRSLLRSGSLPPDWAQLAPGRTSAADVTASGAPGTGESPRYGFDAARLYIRLATSCDPTDRALAADAPGTASAVGAVAIHALDGTATVDYRHPITDIAAAAVLTARRRLPAAADALAAADRQQHDTSTYYGAAWTALGSIELTGHVLGGCAGDPS